MSDGLKNPYKDIFEPEQVRVGRGAAWLAIVCFLAVCIVPPFWRNVSAAGDEKECTAFTHLFRKSPATDITQHLRSAEKKIEDAPFAKAPRRIIQYWQTSALGKGNRKTVIGKEGWLFFRPAVQALAGAGSLGGGGLGVASDPSLKKRRPPLPVIQKFATELEERGIRLLLVPVPVKPMIYPEHLTGAMVTGPVSHPDAPAFYKAIEETGAKVLDLGDRFWSLKDETQVFLKQDTHWTPEAMEVAAGAVAKHLRSSGLAGGDTGRYTLEEIVRESEGDLVEKLDLPEETPVFQDEKTVLHRVVDQATGGRPAPDRTSPVVLLGDSFVNVFDDPNIGFGRRGEKKIGGGFAQHLSARLGFPLDVIAKNGQAATEVREELARRYDDEVRAKKTVIWLIASRDLFYTPKLAGENSVSWRDVKWNTRRRPEIPPGALQVEATLLEAAEIPDPSSLPYPDSVYPTVWEDIKVLRGSREQLENGKLLVQLWAFRQREIVPTGRLQMGGRYRFTAVPLEQDEEAANAQGQPLDTLDNFIDIYYAESVEPAGATGEGRQEADKPGC